jgi:hypothetical protein
MRFEMAELGVVKEQMGLLNALAWHNGRYYISLEVAERLIRVGRRSVRRWQAAYRAQSADALAADRCWRVAWGFCSNSLATYAIRGCWSVTDRCARQDSANAHFRTPMRSACCRF